MAMRYVIYRFYHVLSVDLIGLLGGMSFAKNSCFVRGIVVTVINVDGRYCISPNVSNFFALIESNVIVVAVIVVAVIVVAVIVVAVIRFGRRSCVSTIVSNFHAKQSIFHGHLIATGKETGETKKRERQSKKSSSHY